MITHHDLVAKIVPLSMPKEREVRRSNDISTTLVLPKIHPLEVDTPLQIAAGNQYSANRPVSVTHIDSLFLGTLSSAHAAPQKPQPCRLSTASPLYSIFSADSAPILSQRQTKHYQPHPVPCLAPLRISLTSSSDRSVGPRNVFIDATKARTHQTL